MSAQRTMGTTLTKKKRSYGDTHILIHIGTVHMPESEQKLGEDYLHILIFHLA